MVTKVKIGIMAFMLMTAVMFFPMVASATSLNITVSGTTNNTSDTKNVYYSYTRGLSGIEEDTGQSFTRYIYDIPFDGYFATSSDRYTSGYFKLNIDITLQASDLVSAYVDSFSCPVPFTVDQSNLTSGVIQLNFSVFYNDFQHGTTNCPLPSFVIHCVTSSASIPAIQSLSARSGCRYVITNSTDPVGLENAIADAINNSADVNNIISILTDISDNTDLLSTVISKLTDLDTKLSNIITILNTHTGQNTQEYDLLRKLLIALTGEDVSTNNSAISGRARLYWIGIIQQALQIDQSQATEASSQIANVNGEINNQHSQEAVVYDDLDTNLNAVSGYFTAIPPENITGPVSVIVGWLQVIWTKLGIMQYVVLVSLTVGIILIVLGRFRLR